MKTTESLVIAPDEPAELSVRRILLRLARTIERNWQGVVDDLGADPLHDLRVATRRTRTGLGELKGVLPKKRVAPFRREFKQLTAITGPCRDYDVWLEHLDRDLRSIGRQSTGAAGTVGRAVREIRQHTWRVMKEQLLHPRSQALVPAWVAVLDEKATGTTRHGGRRVCELADERINRAYSRLVRRRPNTREDATDEAMHRTRIDAKKLRYLLEFFSNLYPQDPVNTLVRRLKQLQDQLGRFNDCTVQRHLLGDLRSSLENSDRPTANQAVSVIVDLDEYNRARQSSCRAHFRILFSAFTNDANTQLLSEITRYGRP